MELTEQDARKAGDSGIAYTVVAPSGFFKDYERIFRCSCSCLPLHAAGWRHMTQPTLHAYACLEEHCMLWTVTVRVCNLKVAFALSLRLQDGAAQAPCQHAGGRLQPAVQPDTPRGPRSQARCFTSAMLACSHCSQNLLVLAVLQRTVVLQFLSDPIAKLQDGRHPGAAGGAQHAHRSRRPRRAVLPPDCAARGAGRWSQEPQVQPLSKS